MATSTTPLHVVRAGARAALLATLVTATTPARAAADLPPVGKYLFDQNCGRCHELGLGARDAEGPNLNGIFGRPAGSRRGFSYSAAMRRSAVVWTRKSLDTFIANPQAAMPGTEMVVPGVDSKADRQAIAAYIDWFQSDGTFQPK